MRRFLSAVRRPPAGEPIGRYLSFPLVLVVAVVYLIAWTALDVAAVQFESARGVSVWQPPIALDIVLLLVLGLRFFPLLLLSTIVHELLVSQMGLEALELAAFNVITTAGYAFSAWVLLRVAGLDPRLPSQRDVIAFVVVACGAGPLLVAVGQVLLLQQAGVIEPGEVLVSIGGYWAGAATGIGMLAPVLLVCARRSAALWTGYRPLEPQSHELRRGWLESGLQGALLALTTWLAYGRNMGSALNYTYLVYVPLLWVATRRGFVATAWAVWIVNVGAVLFNRGRVPGNGGIALQFGLVTLTLAGLLLGALVSQRRRDAERHRHQALHDPLTGLPNRALFADRLGQAAGRASRNPRHRFAVLFFDLDRFKSINDSFGHGAGDELLRAVAERLAATIRPGDTVARFGGDEFGALLEGIEDRARLEQIVDRQLAALSEPYAIERTSLVVGASVGSVLARPGASDPSALMRDADIALHHAKRRGKARHVVFDGSMRDQAVATLRMENALRTALERDELRVAFQPVFSRDRRLVAAEALARWRTGGRDVPPAEFIALAEETGLIDLLGRRVLERACAHIAGLPGSLSVAVNVSPIELRRPSYATDVLNVLSHCKLAPTRLELEITETEWLERSASARSALAELAARGVRVLIDDFGTGYSSFGYLRRLPVYGLKIDRSFIAGVSERPDDVSIVKAILAMAAELNLDVTAEGVEHQTQLDFLTDHRCSRFQGFLLGTPEPTLPDSDPKGPSRPRLT